MPTRFRNFCTYIECATPTVVSKFLYSKTRQCSVRPVCKNKAPMGARCTFYTYYGACAMQPCVMGRANGNGAHSGCAVQRSTVGRRCVHATVQHCTAAMCRAACDAICIRMWCHYGKYRKIRRIQKNPEKFRKTTEPHVTLN